MNRHTAIALSIAIGAFFVVIVTCAFYYGFRAIAQTLSRDDVQHWLNQPLSTMKIWQFIAIIGIAVFFIVISSRDSK